MSMLYDAGGKAISGRGALVAGLSIGTMIALNIWNKSRLRLFCILVGMLVGYALSGPTPKRLSHMWPVPRY